LVIMRGAASGLRLLLPVHGGSLHQDPRRDGAVVASEKLTVNAEEGASLGDGVEDTSESTNIKGELARAVSFSSIVGSVMNLDGGIWRLLRVGRGRGGAAVLASPNSGSSWMDTGDEGTV
jgi:hypothetical protein